MADSKEPAPEGGETEIDISTQLEHHRSVLQSITTRSIRALQFNLIVFSVLGGLISFGQSGDKGKIGIASLASSPWTLVGFIVILVGVAAGISSIIYDTHHRPVTIAPLDTLVTSSEEALFDNYRNRIQMSSTLLIISYGSSLFGIMLVLGGVVETAKATAFAKMFDSLPIVSLGSLKSQPIGAVVVGIIFVSMILLVRNKVESLNQSLLEERDPDISEEDDGEDQKLDEAEVERS